MNKQFQIKLLQADLGFRGYGAYHVLCDMLKMETDSLPLNYRVLQKLTKIPKKLLKSVIEEYQLFELLDGCFMLLEDEEEPKQQSEKLPKAERSEKCRQSAQARWARYKEERRKEYEAQKEVQVVVKEEPKEEPKKQTSKQFVKPTIEDVKEYIATMQYKTDPEQFWNFYESKGWFVGKNKMKNWHSAVATWEKSNKNKNLNNKTNGNYNKQQDEIDIRMLRGGGKKDYSAWYDDPFFGEINRRNGSTY
jgi:hypothetical protein